MARLREEFGGLVDDITIRRLVLEDRGIKMVAKKISDIKDREEVSAVVRVTKINEAKTFNKRTGGQGRVRNLDIEDDSGNCRLTLWDEDVELPENMDLEIGTQLTLTDCYVKKTDFGTDISKGKKGKIEKL
ncbi:MAG: OB-fold nucleic acid binding domain-containing protein [Methanomassiliicoccus sp.]|nr:OB-fold nucleic acid binding domain-containing protein [Methanomassiliicoccus sp.]